MDNYSFPINSDWTTDEAIVVVEFLALIECAYQQGVDREKFASHYQNFKKVVNSISEEKQIDKAFQQETGFSLYKVVQEYKKSDKKSIKMR